MMFLTKIFSVFTWFKRISTVKNIIAASRSVTAKVILDIVLVCIGFACGYMACDYLNDAKDARELKAQMQAQAIETKQSIQQSEQAHEAIKQEKLNARSIKQEYKKQNSDILAAPLPDDVVRLLGNATADTSVAPSRKSN